MASNLKLSNDAANACADALSDLLDNGYIRIYDGAQPATADTAITTQVLLAELRFSATASPAAVGGVITFSAITKDSSANATGTATWFRLFSSDGSSVVFDGTVGPSGSDINLSSVAISAGAEVSIGSWSHTVVKS